MLLQKKINETRTIRLTCIFIAIRYTKRHITPVYHVSLGWTSLSTKISFLRTGATTLLKVAFLIQILLQHNFIVAKHLVDKLQTKIRIMWIQKARKKHNDLYSGEKGTDAWQGESGRKLHYHQQEAVAKLLSMHRILIVPFWESFQQQYMWVSNAHWVSSFRSRTGSGVLFWGWDVSMFIIVFAI